MTVVLQKQEGGATSVDFQVLTRGGVKRTRVFKRVQKIAEGLQQCLDRPEVEEDLHKSNVPHVPGTVIESIVSPWAQQLGFQSQKRGLFGDCKVDA
jgi:hypothetical protein